MATDALPLDVLVAEDDDALRQVLALHLAGDGCTVRTAADGAAALESCEAQRPDIVVLDVMLPERTGLEVCATLRSKYGAVPGVVMVTARGSEADVIAGFDGGADDYVIKPCRPREVVARVRALGRRVRPAAGVGAPASVITRGTLTVDLDARSATVHGHALRLTATEFALLVRLAREPGRVFPRMDLLEQVWDSTHPGYARNVDCHVTRLRRKLEAAGLDPAPIGTVHGVGYRFLTDGART